MFISLGEVVIISLIAVSVLKPKEIAWIIKSLSNLARLLKSHYGKVISEVKNWWDGRR